MYKKAALFICLVVCNAHAICMSTSGTDSCEFGPQGMMVVSMALAPWALIARIPTARQQRLLAGSPQRFGCSVALLVGWTVMLSHMMQSFFACERQGDIRASVFLHIVEIDIIAVALRWAYLVIDHLLPQYPQLPLNVAQGQ